MTTFYQNGYILLFVFICLLTSCDNYLDTSLPENQIEHSLVFEQAETAHAALAGLHGNLWEDSPISGTSRGVGALLSTYTDELDHFAPNVTNATFDLYQNQQIPSNSMVYNVWAGAYTKIYQANAIIEGIDNSQNISSNDRNIIKGEALFVRSVMLFYLQQIFGDVPLPTTTDYRINQTIEKTPSAQVLKQLEKDLLLSIQLLNKEYRNVERIYPNRHAATLLLSKIYLLQHQWNKAENLLQEIVSDPQYTLQTDVSKVFDKTGKHVIWQLKPKNNGDATKEALLYYFTNTAPTNFALSTALLSTFSDNDHRKTHWIASVTAQNNTWYRSFKYKNRSANTTEYSIVFRMEEVYLLLSESLARQGKTTEALIYLNALRTRSGLDPIAATSSPTTLLDEIENEFTREFFAEMGQRFLVLKRLDRLNKLSLVKPHWKNYHENWPLPEKELLLNSFLHPQNPGY